LPLWLVVVLWIVTGGLSVVAGMRQFGWDDFEVFAVLNTVTVILYLPAWIVAAVALVGGRFLLAAVALVLVGAQVSFMAPELTAAHPVPQWASGAPTIRLFDANVFYRNPSMNGYATEIRSVQPQLVTMEEATPDDARQLKRSGALTGLPYHFEVRSNEPTAFFVASKYPLSETHVVYFEYLPFIVQLTIELPSGPQQVWVLHTTAPLPSTFGQWKAQLAYVDLLLRDRGGAGLLVVGDFNATWGNKGFRAILNSGLADGAAARGQALEMTWSQTLNPLPPLVRIDHVLTGAGVTVTDIQAENGPGSDHRDLIATVAIKR
jgi:endonuclease/exonuclease/phosphatase (EEP) superfamily protein YafD